MLRAGGQPLCGVPSMTTLGEAGEVRSIVFEMSRPGGRFVPTTSPAGRYLVPLASVECFSHALPGRRGEHVAQRRAGQVADRQPLLEVVAAQQDTSVPVDDQVA